MRLTSINSLIYNGPPSTAERYLDLAWVVTESVGYGFDVKAWRGKSRKWFAYIAFKTREQADAWINDQKKNADARVAYKAEEAARRKERKAQAAAEIGLGTLLVNSWGYDQTNLDFYQVVERKGLTVKLRKIGAEEVKGSAQAHGMACNFRAKANSFASDEVITKRITANGVQFEHGWTSVTDESKSHYCSWYH